MSGYGAVVNVVFAGLGGQGVVTASQILAAAAFRAGHDVKQSEVHGMSQRGGSVTADVRFGAKVLSPMVPRGAADYLVLLDEGERAAARPLLREGGVLLDPSLLPDERLPNRRSLVVALLGALATRLDLPDEAWEAALRAKLPPHLLDLNVRAFEAGRAAGGAISPGP